MVIDDRLKYMMCCFFGILLIFCCCISNSSLAENIETVDSNVQTNNANLQVLRLDKEGIIPEFQKDIYKYYLTVSNDIESIDIEAIGENPNSIIEITGNTNLKEGLNIIEIKVLSEDKTQSNMYTIEVTKTDNVKLANTNLEILAIENVMLNPPFDVNKTQYDVEISNETSNLNILAIPENQKASVQIEGNDILKEGSNLISVTVIAEDGFSKKVYKINVHKRNRDEEANFEEDKQENLNKLEQIYKVERMSASSNVLQKDGVSKIEINNKKQNINFVVIIVVFIFIVMAIILLYFYIRK